jgi:hypothetical protein
MLFRRYEKDFIGMVKAAEPRAELEIVTGQTDAGLREAAGLHPGSASRLPMARR